MFASVASLLWIVTTFYSIGYMRGTHESNQTRYYICFALALSSTLGVAFSANLLTLYVFYEILSLVTVPLVGHKGTAESSAGAKKYLIYLAGASKSALLAAMVLTYSVAGTLNFSSDGLLSPQFENAMGVVSPALLTLIYVLFLVGFAKAAIMPLHSWLPAAMVAPTPVSALLHAVAVVKVGVFSVLRVIFHVFGVGLMEKLHLGIPTLFLVSYTIIMASVYALTRDNLKARLAYSTVSQLSYVILGAALLSPSGMMGGIVHIAAHAFSKITLFFCAGSIYVATHKTCISEMSGIGRKMPWTMTAFTIGAFGMIGVPPLAGFLSKWYLVSGAIEARNIPVLIVLLSSTIFNAAYFLPVIYKAFFEPLVGCGSRIALTGDVHSLVPQSLGAAANHDEGETKEAPFIVVPLMFTAIGSILIGLFPDYFLELAKRVIQ
ncbi:MAG: monovalent cation/H+ antiporter subunit D family protein [Nitrospirae bacterium]|nr:monovalent cation/H+ antiporter subunit D family protein [Candidatus Troglogloeales bacterium]